MAEYLIQDTTLTEIADAIRNKTGKTATMTPATMVTEISGISTGEELNFEIVGGTTQPSSPSENTIWLNTSTDVTSWDFSATEPTVRSGTRNLIPYPYTASSMTTNGVTFGVYSDGRISVNGTNTATGSVNFYLTPQKLTGNELVLQKGTYTLCQDVQRESGQSISLSLYYSYDNWATSTTVTMPIGSNYKTFTLTEQAKAFILIWIAAGETLSNAIFKPQLEVGSTATAFTKGDATGQVWVQTAASSSSSFNALKENNIQVYPVSVKQYISGAWVGKTGKIYKNAAWATFFSSTIKVTYPSGSTCTCKCGSTTLTASGTSGSYTFTVPFAGTWTVSCTNGTNTSSSSVSITASGESKSVTLAYEFIAYNAGTFNTSFQTSAVSFNTGSYLNFKSNMTYTSDKLFDVTPYKNVCVNISAESGDTNSIVITLLNSSKTAVATVTKSATTGEHVLDISSVNQSCYLEVKHQTGDKDFYIRVDKIRFTQ